MLFHISQSTLSEPLKQHIYQLFAQHAQALLGFNGLDEPPMAFEAHHGGEWCGAVVAQLFWGQLHIKYLVVAPAWRGQGLAQQLMEQACDYGRSHGANLAFVETMSFQAPELYQKLGFELEFERSGFAGDSRFIYLKKAL